MVARGGEGAGAAAIAREGLFNCARCTRLVVQTHCVESMVKWVITRGRQSGRTAGPDKSSLVVPLRRSSRACRGASARTAGTRLNGGGTRLQRAWGGRTCGQRRSWLGACAEAQRTDAHDDESGARCQSPACAARRHSHSDCVHARSMPARLLVRTRLRGCLCALGCAARVVASMLRSGYSKARPAWARPAERSFVCYWVLSRCSLAHERSFVLATSRSLYVASAYAALIFID